MTSLAVELKKAAARYFQRGWVAMPLALDQSGLPKRPIVTDWTQLTLDAKIIGGLPWEQARGLGIVLGPVSGGLGVLDIDDTELAAALAAIDLRTRVIGTIRKRLHIYCYEQTPSNSTRFTCEWKGRPIGIELKAQGTQVATWPTPGYTLINDVEPIVAPSVEMGWLSICSKFSILMPHNQGNYPTPWQAKVGKGERNKSIYVEAHKLREAGLSYDVALEIMIARLQQHYEDGDMAWREAERTIQSAYRTPVPEMFGEDTTDDNQYF